MDHVGDIDALSADVSELADGLTVEQSTVVEKEDE
ncbi:MAG: hypothetical protein ACI83Y_002605 [Candidatus Azotimanducaceae bacterium]|jgi:hypothetical protein